MARKDKKRPSVALARARSARKAAPQKGAKAAQKPSSREKVCAHRARMRKRGFGLVQMWLPDTRSPEFAAQAHRASLAIANSPTEAEDQAWVDSISWWNSPLHKAERQQ